MSQEELACRCGPTRTYISLLERSLCGELLDGFPSQSAQPEPSSLSHPSRIGRELADATLAPLNGPAANRRSDRPCRTASRAAPACGPRYGSARHVSRRGHSPRPSKARPRLDYSGASPLHPVPPAPPTLRTPSCPSSGVGQGLLPGSVISPRITGRGNSTQAGPELSLGAGQQTRQLGLAGSSPG